MRTPTGKLRDDCRSLTNTSKDELRDLMTSIRSRALGEVKLLVQALLRESSGFKSLQLLKLGGVLEMLSPCVLLM